MTDYVQYKTGKKEATYSRDDLRFTEFRNSKSPIVVPSTYGHGGSFTDWGMLGNDEYGDCVFAGGDHETMLLNNLAAGGVINQQVVKFAPKNALADYGAVTGFNPATGEGDNGTQVRDALDYRKKTGLIDENGKRHKIAAYVSIEPGNIQHLIEAIFTFEVVGIGFEFPVSAMDQFNRNQVWSVVPGSRVEGGHYVPLVGKPAIGNLAVVTWGKRQVMTEGFFKKYCDEAWAFITEEELTKRSKEQHNWGGFSWADLNAALGRL